MSKKQVIQALAVRYADRRRGGGRYWTYWRGACIAAIKQYAKNWLAEHGSLPEGVHVCRHKNSRWANGMKVEVDFTRLMHDPTYPEREGPPEIDPAKQRDIAVRGEVFLMKWRANHPSSSLK